MSNDENSNKEVFCVTATDAKQQYCLEARDLKDIDHQAIGGRYYGGNYKLFTPASLEEAAIKKHGKEGLALKRRNRQERFVRAQEKRRHEQEAARKCWEESKRKAAIPKKGISAWQLFQKEHHSKTRKANPDKSPTEIMKLVSVRYRSLPAEERKVLDDQVARDKDQYEKQLKAYECKYGSLKR